MTEEKAIEIAKKDVGQQIGNEVESITARYVKFTNHSGGMDSPALVLPGTNIVLEDISVWIVTFHGVNAPRYGPGLMLNSKGEHIAPNVDPYVYGDLNVVIDANSGNVLEAFSYNIPRH